MNSASTTPTTGAPGKFRRWALSNGDLRIIAGIVLALVAAVAYWIYDRRSDWARAEAEIDQADPRWRFHELEADRKQVPDEENSGLHCIKVANMGAKLHVSDAPKYNDIFAGMAPNARLSVEQEMLIRTELAKVAKALPEARKLKDMPWGRLPTRYWPEGSPKFPEIDVVYTLVDWLEHDAYLLAHEEEFDRAWESCQGAYNAGDAMGDDCTQNAWICRGRLQQRTVALIERVLGQGRVESSMLLAMQRRLEPELLENRWLTQARGMRADYHLFVELVRSGKFNHSELQKHGYAEASLMGDPVVDFKGAFATRYRFADKLRHYDRLVEIAKLPVHERRPLIVAWEKDAKKYENQSCCFPSRTTTNWSDEECVTQALLRATVVAVACERYRLAHDVFPASLDVLVKDKLLDVMPADPIDNQSLRYRVTNDHVVVYSIGPDGVDNGGNTGANWWSSDRDVGFRLWRQEARRQAPRAFVPPPKQK